MTRGERKRMMFHILYGASSTQEDIKKALAFIDGDEPTTEPIVVDSSGKIPRYCQFNCKEEGPPGPIWCRQCGHDPKCCNCDDRENYAEREADKPTEIESYKLDSEELGQRFLDYDE